MTVAVFDYGKWAARYPELAATVEQCLAEELFGEAGLYCANTDASVIPAAPGDYQPRLRLLGMLVAHLAYLSSPARQGTVGRVSQASQGSVSASLEMGPATGSSAWFLQTPYGANFWQASAPYRMGRYIPPKRC